MDQSADAPAHFDGSCVRLDQAVEHFEEGGLARAIAPDEADAFAAAERWRRETRDAS